MPRSTAVYSLESKRATLKLVGNVTCSTLTGWSGGRNACGSGLHNVTSAGSKPSHTVASVYADLSGSVASPGMRLRYGKGGMFMIDMQGTFALATAFKSSRT